MTGDEVVSLLANMVVAWPSMEVHPALTDLWVRHLADVDVAAARTAFDRCVVSDEWPPTVARFRELCAAAAPQVAPPALPLPRLPLPEARAAIADARAQLRPDR